MLPGPGSTPSAGLTSGEAAARLAEVGPNELPQVAGAPLWRQLLGQFVHFFALMLWGAAALALIGGLPQLAVAIVLVVVVNGGFAFVQEYRAERAAQRLRELLPSRVVVVRDGRQTTVGAAEIVPEDLVLLREGDRICADMTCVWAEGLMVDTSMLTGESVPDAVGAGGRLFAGTFIVEGQGSAVVSGTGRRTRFAEIAEFAQAQPRPRTPLELDIRRLVRTIAIIAGGVGVTFFLLMLLLGVPVAQGFIFGIGVTVALVPEGLLPTVTLSLAIGAQRMAEQRALVRRLESVETLGATTVICSDKTGTITENRMNVVEVWTPQGVARIAGQGYQPTAEVRCPDQARDAVTDAVLAARMTCRGEVRQVDGQWRPHGDPMDAAIDALLRRLAVPEPVDDELGYEPFDPVRRMAVSRRADRVVCKGAPEEVMAVCDDLPEQAQEQMHAYALRGLRVLAVAQGQGMPGMRLLGLLAFEDPPRAGVTEAIAACRSAGIRLAMITGDHPKTARAIAAETGLALPDSPVVTGAQLPADDAALGELVDHDGVVLARITPEDKLRIARALRARGHVVAMTGDGVNDAPALREADIGVAMGEGGTDVAREAADLVLLDDHLQTIVAAVRQGRGTFLNARRFLTYHLTDNVAELAPFVAWAVSAAHFPLALGVLQILALDLGTDTLPAIALGAEKPSERVLDHKPVTGGLLDRTVAVRAFGVLGPTEALVELGVFVAALMWAGWRPGLAWPSGHALLAASGAAFLTVVVMQCANAFACRSTRWSAWRLGWRGNRFLLVAVALALAFGLATLLVPAVARLLGQAWPPAAVLPLIALSGPLLLTVDAVWKRVTRGPAPRSGGESRGR
ncbi:MAG TPA: cation-transporting P-type ATPase [Actinomycetota bacterium]|nr:cation-transporting P-type ATPase [Actinomycetota bacterium]